MTETEQEKETGIVIKENHEAENGISDQEAMIEDAQEVVKDADPVLENMSEAEEGVDHVKGRGDDVQSHEVEDAQDPERGDLRVQKDDREQKFMRRMKKMRKRKLTSRK